jgi:hypothetical protein
MEFHTNRERQTEDVLRALYRLYDLNEVFFTKARAMNVKHFAKIGCNTAERAFLSGQ